MLATSHHYGGRILWIWSYKLEFNGGLLNDLECEERYNSYW